MAETFSIRLEDVRLFGRHGVFPEERIKGNDFSIDLRVDYQAPDSDEAGFDQLEGTISYADLYDIVKAEMATTRNLLETVAKAIAITISERYPQADAIICKITKLYPPIPDFNGRASVTYSITKDTPAL